jgi:hypothetical protein
MPRADQFIKAYGFRVEISGPAGGKNEDNAWETCTGGALMIKLTETSPGPDASAASAAPPGAKSVNELVLRGPMTDGRRAMMDWINNTVAGIDDRRTVTIVEIMKDGSDGRRFDYHDCFITKYELAPLQAAGTGNLYEEVHIKPIRLELA